MNQDDYFRFVNLLALELENGDIALPSLPDVVLKIRQLLEKDDCDFDKVSKAVSVDPVLVSKLFVYANSAYYNRANVKIESLEGAIGRLGFEVVRSTAMSLAMKQLYYSEKHSKASKLLKTIWARGMKLSCMAFAVARRHTRLNVETAFLCGLMHEVGKLYIITKAEDFPQLLGDRDSLDAVMRDWNPQISKSIVESWGFPQEVIESCDPSTFLDADEAAPAALVDVVYVARKLLDDDDEVREEGGFAELPSCAKMGIGREQVPDVMQSYRDKLKTMQESLV